MKNNFIEGNYEDKYNTKNPISRFLMNRFLKSFEKLLIEAKKNKNISSICEIGCGEGELLKIIRKHFPTAKIYASDLSKNEVEKAKINCKDLNIEFSVQNAQGLKYKNKQFDLLIACEVLEHIPYPNKAIEEIKRLSDLAIISTPIEPLWRILNMLRFKYVKDLGNTPGHLNHWSVPSLRKFFNVFDIRAISNAKPYPWQMYLLSLNSKDKMLY